MRKILALALVAAAGGGWLFFHKYRLEGLNHLGLAPREQATATESAAEAPPAEQFPVSRKADTIRIASFDIQAFGMAKQGKPDVMRVLTEVMRRFDVIAIQEIRTDRDDLLPRFVEQINASGRHYDFIVGPRLGRAANQEQYAFVFDAGSVEIDRSATYTVGDPGRVLAHDPLAASFRVRGPDHDEAFTFTLVNVHVNPDASRAELDALANVYRAVRNDGRGEDDIILLGNLNADDRHLGYLGQLPNMTWALAQTPTNTRGTKMYDNILFNRQATTEFSGRAGVLDLLHEFHLTMAQALEVSDHLPVWAEFSMYEGGQTGRMANAPGANHD